MTCGLVSGRDAPNRFLLLGAGLLRRGAQEDLSLAISRQSEFLGAKSLDLHSHRKYTLVHILRSTEKGRNPRQRHSLIVPAMHLFAHNLKRLMAQLDLTVVEVARQTGLDERTVKSILAGASSKPHARTLHQLARGLGVETNEFFHSPHLTDRNRFDRHTNPTVDELIDSRPELFSEWSAADFDELYSRMGSGGPLTSEGALRAAEAINRKRELHDKLALLLETEQADVIAGILDLFYRRVKASP
jgi:transcriptional regulator with XRE-family HTH domain